MSKLNLSRIISVSFPVRKYFRKVFDKKQIVLHHTVSGNGINGDITHWIKSKFRMGTCIIVGRRGDINQVFSSKFWAYHLGVPGSTYKKMGIQYKRWDMNSIGIEIDSYGGLKYNGALDQWETVYGNRIPDSNVQLYPNKYRGYSGFEKYTPEQIQSVKELLIFWSDRYGISLKYNADMWEVSAEALKGKQGVWSHTSFRFDKSDIHPQPEIIEMLKSL
tara:strand:+ start:2239 stop:2895 length:657 start_codon:yes stop_codon:yes gene_type:complete